MLSVAPPKMKYVKSYIRPPDYILHLWWSGANAEISDNRTLGDLAAQVRFRLSYLSLLNTGSLILVNRRDDSLVTAGVTVRVKFKTYEENGS
jgi:hypothetical protein